MTVIRGLGGDICGRGDVVHVASDIAFNNAASIAGRAFRKIGFLSGKRRLSFALPDKIAAFLRLNMY